MTDGEITARFRSIDELGLTGYDAFRQLQSGAFQIMAISPGYVSGDDPFVLGFDLPGIMPELETARAVADAYREPLNERVRAMFDGEVLAVWPYPASMLFCRGEIDGLEDLQGRKVRVSSPALNDLVSYFGATGVTLPFSEVYPSLQRNLVDCATAASLSGYQANWHEVTDTLFTLPLSWTLQLHVANGGFWDGLSGEQRASLTAHSRTWRDEMWSVAGKASRRRDRLQHQHRAMFIWRTRGHGPCRIHRTRRPILEASCPGSRAAYLGRRMQRSLSRLHDGVDRNGWRSHRFSIN